MVSAVSASTMQPLPPLLGAVLAVLKAAAEERHEITRTKLVKLLYFADLAAVEAGGTAFTGATWRWDNYGPYDHALRRTEDAVVTMGIVDRDDRTAPFEYGACHLSLTRSLEIEDPLPGEAMEIIRQVVHDLGGKSATALKDLSYKTPPMIEAETAGDRNVLLDLSRARRRKQVSALRERVRRNRRERSPQARDAGVADDLLAEYERIAPSIRRINAEVWDDQ